MQIPVIRGLIDRRILVNFRVDADVLARLVPAPFRPKLVNGAGMAGVCLIRLKGIRPRFLPSFLGIPPRTKFAPPSKSTRAAQSLAA